MKMPRRRPRAVYEVYDAEEALAGQEGFTAAERQAPASTERAAPNEDREGLDVLSALPVRRALRRMLAGAALCLAVVCVIAAVAIVLLHAVSGAGSAARRSAPPARAAHDSRGRVATPAAAPAPVAIEPRRLVRGVRRALSAPAASTRAPVARSSAAEMSSVLSPPPAVAASSALEISPAGISGCECAAAEAEFGFER